MRAYISTDLSRKRFKESVNRKREKEKAKLYHGRYLVDEDVISRGKFIPRSEDKIYAKRFYRGKHRNSRSSYYKKISNRTVRRTPIDVEIPDGGGYRRRYDYWWTVD